MFHDDEVDYCAQEALCKQHRSMTIQRDFINTSSFQSWVQNSGVMISLTSDVTMAPNAAPIITAMCKVNNVSMKEESFQFF